MIRAELNRSLHLDRLGPNSSLIGVDLPSGVYPLELAPNPLGDDRAPWLVVLDTDIGMAAGMWLDADYQVFRDFKVYGWRETVSQTSEMPA